MHDHFVAHLDVGDVLAHCVDNAGRIATANVEILGLAGLVASADHIDGNTHSRPDVVVVDYCRHHVNEDLVVGNRRRIHYFLLERCCRLAKALGANQPGVHLFRNFAQGRPITHFVKLLAHQDAPSLVELLDQSDDLNLEIICCRIR